ncbi:hypothetical protein [Streptomyces sp. NBRC 110465]|uniref:hypothetical protein n=1 Tax=Streptomyces sp. NBRC 110465 TaxID=1897621 RepID=UPI00093517A0|nr:hypothetical protein [Streptomyces sp. NBRC 110465]
MLRRPLSAPTFVDALPKVEARQLRPGDLLMHRGLPGRNEGAARPVVRVEPVQGEPGWVLIVQESVWFPGGETRERARAGEGVALAPPYWPHGVDRVITHEDIRAAREHVGGRAIQH